MIELALAVSLACSPPAGFGEIIRRPERVIVIGELHGTEQAPAALAEMACALAEVGPLTIGVELADTMKTALAAFLNAPDDQTALQALEGTLFLDPRWNDGRSSQAMLQAMNRIRALKAAGRDIEFHPFQPSSPRPSGMTQAWSELNMAREISRGVWERPQARMLILTGNIHARKTGQPRWPEVGLPATGHLPAADTLSLRIAQQGGSAWNCSGDDCGVDRSIVQDDPDLRGVILVSTDDGAHDGLLALGPSTASFPIRQGAD